MQQNSQDWLGPPACYFPSLWFWQFFLVEFHIYSRLVLVPVNTGQQGYTRSATKGLILYYDNNFLKLCNTSYS